MTNERFIVIHHEYMNTGGNTMVSIFTVYDRSAKATRYVIANELGFNWQTADTVSNCDFTLDNDEMIEEIVLGSWDWNALTTEPAPLDHQFEDDEWELFKYCQFEFLKKDCKYFGTKCRLAINELSVELFNKLPRDYIDWANENDAGCLTDGYDVFLDDNYSPIEDEYGKQKQEVINFQRRLEELAYEAVDSEIIVAVNGQYVKIPLHADSYQLLDEFINKIIKEW